ncbi:MAG: hypothetical protein ABMB14_05085 [Myxococcota bacterium]
MILFVLGAAASAGTTASVDVLAGARGDPEATLEQPTNGPDAGLEPTATAAVLAEVRRSWKKGPWLGVAGEAWTYLPEADPTLLRVAPRGGLALRLGDHAHLDAGARYALEIVPLRTSLDSGRAEVTLATGPILGDHAFDLVATGVDRAWFGTPAWSFRTVEGGMTWAWQPSDWRLGARATGQANAGSTIGPGGALEAATGQQLRLGVSTGYTKGSVDVSADYRMYLASEGQVEDAVRPQFTPIGEYDDDADALSAGGFVQHRLSATVGATFGLWTLSADALGRIRINEDGQSSAALTRTGHLAFDVGRDLGDDGFQVHGVLGVNGFATPTGAGSFDPYGWLGVRWRLPP